MKPTKEILFYFDAEWVPLANTAEGLKETHPELYVAFMHRCEKWNKEKNDKGEPACFPEYYWDTQAHWYPELCKIICVSFAWYQNGELILKSSYGEDEKKVLEPLVNLFNKVQSKGFIPCGAGILRFDIPFIAKRMMTNGLIPPNNLNLYGIKPWDIKIYDILDVWGQGCKGESFTPFEWICASLGISSSKDDISGADVKRVYYSEGEKGLERIKTYCEKDVKKTIEVAIRLIELTY